MSFLEKLGTFTKNLSAAPFAPARFIYEAASAPWRDEEEYNGFIQSFKTASEPEKKDIIKPLASAAGAIMKVPGVQPALEKISYINQEYIREPITTFVLAEASISRTALVTLLIISSFKGHPETVK